MGRRIWCVPRTAPLSPPCHADPHAGGIVRVSALGNSIIVLNRAQDALNMLDKKSRLYSDRPTLMMAGRLVGWDAGPALIPMCDTWSEFRRLFAQFMGSRAKVEAFHDVLQSETDLLLRRVLAAPDAWTQHSRRFVIVFWGRGCTGLIRWWI